MNQINKRIIWVNIPSEGDTNAVSDPYLATKWRVGVLTCFIGRAVEEYINDILDSHCVDAQDVISIAITGCEVKIFYRYVEVVENETA